MTAADTKDNGSASAARSASADAEAPSCPGTAAPACIAVVFALQLTLVAAAIGTLAVCSSENATGCERLVDGLFTTICVASVVAAAALVAQAWRDRGRDATPELLHSAHGAEHRDAIDALGHGMRVTGDHILIAPCAAPDVCLEVADTINNQEP
nr:hypothetical protein [Pandoravirus belohorizontensis]